LEKTTRTSPGDVVAGQQQRRVPLAALEEAAGQAAGLEGHGRLEHGADAREAAGTEQTLAGEQRRVAGAEGVDEPVFRDGRAHSAAAAPIASASVASTRRRTSIT
jgi:hypothetical protein